MKKVDKNSPIPLYYQLKDIISEMIENEELKPGEPVPPEREICEEQGISRMTVNKAIINLVNEGLLFREQGRGTFVAYPKQDYSVSGLTSLTEEMIKKGLRVDTNVISFEIKESSKRVREILDLYDGAEVIEIKRLRIVSNEPYAIETSYIPKYLCSDFTRERIEGKSLYHILEEEYGLKMEYAHQTIEPVILDEYEANLLEMEDNKLALMFSRRTYMKDGTPLEYTKSIYRGDRYKFEIILRR